MSCDKAAYFGDLFELTIDTAAEKLFAGLSDQDLASIDDIKKALVIDITNGKLKPVRGCITFIGKQNNFPPILDAYKVAEWAEKNGLWLENDGAFFDYIDDELELSILLEDKLVFLRSLQALEGKSISEILKHPDILTERQQDYLSRILLENEQIKNKQIEVEQNQIDKKIHTRAEKSYLTIIGALLDYIEGKTPTIDPHPNFINESKLIETLSIQYAGYDGMSQSNLSHKFPTAHSAVSQS